MSLSAWSHGYESQNGQRGDQARCWTCPGQILGALCQVGFGRLDKFPKKSGQKLFGRVSKQKEVFFVEGDHFLAF